MRQLQFIVLSLLFFFHPSFSLQQSQSIHFKLHRRGRAPDRLHHPSSHLKPLLLSDLQRQHWIRSTIRRNLASSKSYHPTCQSTSQAFEMPIGSGAYTGTGQYFVRVRVGTPAKPFLLVADTGSDLTWVKCQQKHSYGAKEDKESARPRIFKPEQSSSWRPIECTSHLCRKTLPFALETCPTPDSPCLYDYSYSDGSRTQGVFANESATIALSNGKKTKLHGLVIGCSTNSSGTSFSSSDGVLGLGYSSTSFASLASSLFGGLFSYCLVDHLAPRNLSSLLTFGPTIFTSLVPSPPRVTPLILDSRLSPFYAVSIKCISVDNKTLDIPPKVWDINSGGGTILDSGTSLTVLVDPAYQAVVTALSQKLSGLPPVQMDPFDYCYNWTSIGSNADLQIPKLVLHFEGAARLEPPSKSYIIDVAPGVKCIGITSAPWPGTSTIGNILQQEHVWEFDIRKKQLRFEHSKCQQH